MKKEVKDLQDWAAVQRLRSKGCSITDIARQLHMSRTTVYTLLNKKEEPVYVRHKYPSKVERYAEQIIEWRYSSRYEFNGTRIYRELKKLGYKGSISPVYLFLKKISEKDYTHTELAVPRIETPAGDQAQFDWSPYDVWIGDVKTRVYCFTMILAASRKKAICFSLKDDGDSIYEAIQELFEDLGGVTLELLIDNPKALVISNNPKTDDEVEYNPHALLLAKHLGLELNACNCYWPRTKGKIEKPYQYIEEQFIKGNIFKDMNDLNTRGKTFINEWCDETHGTTKKVPNIAYELEEKQILQPLPNKKLHFKQLESRVVSPDGFISIFTNKYSLPANYAKKTVYYRILYGYCIKVYQDKNEAILIDTLLINDGKHKTIINDEHFSAIKHISKSIPQIRRDFTATFKYGKEYLDIASSKFTQPTYHARGILKLLEMFNVKDIDCILRYAIDHEILDIKSIKKLIKEKGFEILHPVEKDMSSIIEEQQKIDLTRKLDYYETNTQEMINV